MDFTYGFSRQVLPVACCLLIRYCPTLVSGYVLADEGYDVWLGNARGNTYSMWHTKFTTQEKKFWDFR
jgi:hypothetical protein